MVNNNRDHGASAVEFALVAPLLIALLLGILAFGHAFHVQSVLSNAARDAVRVVSLANATHETDAHSAARQTAITSAQPSVSLKNDHINITPDACGAADNLTSETATVTITYPLELLGGIGNITLTGKGTMRCNG
ncbi:TadE/TadG family type IV pilus assembly protein [Enteractinococcus coprophilus]|uniref:TadE-like protein n=1 Tax=Enteractinococcus coprophilus TaxID=1027633 RepID=A0A543AGE3_9MICC|nr:TadE/TadG family type IV pilus assembly protein [Enteractinococcus coprophilus]TQL71649.1 TadE-like protein [Enteractinococcus coprophilus]